MTNNLRPIHPGEILRGELEDMGLSARATAKALRVPVNRITTILNEKRAVTADTALRLMGRLSKDGKPSLSSVSLPFLTRAARPKPRPERKVIRRVHEDHWEASISARLPLFDYCGVP